MNNAKSTHCQCKSNEKSADQAQSNTGCMQTSSFHTEMSTELPLVKDAITSRVLVDNQLLSITEFTMDEGQALSEHTSTCAAVVTVVSGNILFTMKGEEKNLVPGDVVYMRPHELHALTAAEATRFVLTQVKVDENKNRE
ncbi:Cupin domain [Actinobaculum suis]|uniref:Cupin domain n=2 Tax=Actinobaculum suis TaxID=1657 RepID=A0A7Z8YAA7_9ACTO|nr:Cupin domain [Actinobaculum suis]